MTPYSYIWEYQVAPGSVAEFEREYGPQGAWVRLFQKAQGYVGTMLLRDREQPLRYITIDTWESIYAYRSFRDQYGAEYGEIDRRCAHFTARETSLGEFDSPGQGST